MAGLFLLGALGLIITLHARVDGGVVFRPHTSQYNSGSGADSAEAFATPVAGHPSSADGVFNSSAVAAGGTCVEAGAGVGGAAAAPARALPAPISSSAGGAGSAALPPPGRVAPPLPPSVPGHLLRNIRAQDLRLRGGGNLGEGSFGAVQLGEWGDVEVAVKSNNVSCLDAAAIAREREMYVIVSMQHGTGRRTFCAGRTRWLWMLRVFFIEICGLTLNIMFAASSCCC
jgi:hypothetical protein